MSIKIDYRIEFERTKKAVAVQGIFGGSGTVIIVDKRREVKYKKDFEECKDALIEFGALASCLVEREDRADRVAEVIRKCKGE